MTKKTIFLALFFLGISTVCFSETPPKREPPSRSQLESRREKALKQIQEMDENLEKLEQEHLEMLKKRNPAAYQETMRIKDISGKVSEIVTSFRKGQLGEGEARRRLTPLVKQIMEGRSKGLDSEIEATRKRLEYLKSIKANPDLLVKNQVDRYLGKPVKEEDPEY